MGGGEGGNEEAEERPIRWVVFDGPVDSLWMENLNTLLDDNRKLCLSAGETVHLPTEVKLVFETSDGLGMLSPSTLSRCGVVFLQPGTIEWSDRTTTLIEQLVPEKVRRMHAPLIRTYLEWVAKPTLAFIRANCGEVVTTSDSWLIRSFLVLFSAIVKTNLHLFPDRGGDAREPLGGGKGGTVARGVEGVDFSIFRTLLEQPPRPSPLSPLLLPPNWSSLPGPPTKVTQPLTWITY